MVKQESCAMRLLAVMILQTTKKLMESQHMRVATFNQMARQRIYQLTVECASAVIGAQHLMKIPKL